MPPWFLRVLQLPLQLQLLLLAPMLLPSLLLLLSLQRQSVCGGAARGSATNDQRDAASPARRRLAQFQDKMCPKYDERDAQGERMSRSAQATETKAGEATRERAPNEEKMACPD